MIVEKLKLECGVCSKDFITDADSECKIQVSNCNHLFHENCINAWLETNASCPQCHAAVNGLQSLHSTLSVISIMSLCQDYRVCYENLLIQQEENIREMEILKIQNQQLIVENIKWLGERADLLEEKADLLEEKADLLEEKVELLRKKADLLEEKEEFLE